MAQRSVGISAWRRHAPLTPHALRYSPLRRCAISPIPAIPLDWLVRSVVVEHPVQHYGSPILRINLVCFVAYLYTFSTHLC